MFLSHKIALDPTAEQANYFARACGVARFAWNWALAEWHKQYKEGGKPLEGALAKQLNAIKREQFPWMLEVTKVAPKQAIKNLGYAFKRFFEGKAKYPNFKKKGDHDSFRAENGDGKGFAFDGRRIRLPVIGWIKMREALRFQGKVVSATVSRVADRWFVSVTVEIKRQVPVRENQAVVGVDLGIKALATMSDGSRLDGPKAYRSNLKRLKRLDRSLSRKVKGSANRRKAKAKVARLHARISNIRKDGLHKLTTDLVNRFSTIAIEDLNVRGMSANRKVSCAMADMGFYEFRQQLTYKAEMAGARIVVADRWFPSSKTCSDCNHVIPMLPLKARDWTCPACGSVHDRDVNAAKNLRNIAASPAVTACGAKSAGGGLAPAVKLSAMKQEPGHVTIDHG